MERFRKALGRFEKAYRKFAEVAEGENLESFFKREFVVEITINWNFWGKSFSSLNPGLDVFFSLPPATPETEP